MHAGEVCGLAGLQGQGQTILLEGLFGLRRATGTLQVGRHRGPFRHPGLAVDAGVALVPEDRKSEGGHLDFTVRANITLPTLDRFTRATVIRRRLEQVRARAATAALSVRPADPELPLSNLSGGNQQKVVLARWLEAGPSVLLLADPTRGVDIATKQEIYRIIRAEADRGVGVLLVSTELPELLGLCDRVLVMVDGRIAAEFDGDGLTEEAVMAVAAGAELVHAVTAFPGHAGRLGRSLAGARSLARVTWCTNDVATFPPGPRRGGCVAARRSTRRRSPSTACSSPRSAPTSPSTRAR